MSEGRRLASPLPKQGMVPFVHDSASELSIEFFAEILPDRFTPLALIGKGASGIVLRAADNLLQRELAIKMMQLESPDPERARQRFLRESKALASLSHPNIVRVHSFGLAKNEQAYLVMELLEGQTLQDELARSGTLPTERFAEIFRQILDGLEHAHAAKIVHRDLKPGNIMLCKNENGIELKLIDFGIAKIDSAAGVDPLAITKTMALIGSPDYMSPEQCRSEAVDQRSDIYSLACIMYECIVGVPPFKSETPMETMYKQSAVKPSPLTSSSSSKHAALLAAVVDSCLEKDPNNRPQSVAELRAKLDKVFQSDTLTLSLFKSESKPAKKPKSMQDFALAVPVVLLLFGVIYMFSTYKKMQTTENILHPASALEKQEITFKNQLIRFKNSWEREGRPLSSIHELMKRYENFVDGQIAIHDFKQAEDTALQGLSFLDSCPQGAPEVRLEQVLMHKKLGDLYKFWGLFCDPSKLEDAYKATKQSLALALRIDGASSKIANAARLDLIEDCAVLGRGDEASRLLQDLIKNENDGEDLVRDNFNAVVGVPTRGIDYDGVKLTSASQKALEHFSDFSIEQRLSILHFTQEAAAYEISKSWNPAFEVMGCARAMINSFPSALTEKKQYEQKQKQLESKLAKMKKTSRG